jgi:hypothetical protein
VTETKQSLNDDSRYELKKQDIDHSVMVINCAQHAVKRKEKAHPSKHETENDMHPRLLGSFAMSDFSYICQVDIIDRM